MSVCELRWMRIRCVAGGCRSWQVFWRFCKRTGPITTQSGAPRGTAADHLTASHLPCCPRSWQAQYMAEKWIKCAVCDWTQSLCGILKQLRAVLLNPFLLFQWWKDWKCTSVILLNSPQMLYRRLQIRKKGVRIFTCVLVRPTLQKKILVS